MYDEIASSRRPARCACAASRNCWTKLSASLAKSGIGAALDSGRRGWIDGESFTSKILHQIYPLSICFIRENIAPRTNLDIAFDQLLRDLDGVEGSALAQIV